MSKKMKLNLEELKVQSFITMTDGSFLRTIIGAQGQPDKTRDCETFAYGNCQGQSEVNGYACISEDYCSKPCGL